MDALQQLKRRRETLRREAGALSDRLADETLSTEDRTEVRANFDTLMTDAEAVQEDITRVQKTYALADRTDMRRDIARGADSPATREVTADAIAQRDDLVHRGHIFGELSTEEERVIANTTFAGENLTHLALAEKFFRDTIMTEQERAAYNAFHAARSEAIARRNRRMQRALGAEAYDATATHGAEYVPTTLQSAIFAQAVFEGPLAADTGFVIERIPHHGNVDVGTLARATPASVGALGTDGTLEDPLTGKIELVPNKYQKLAGFPEELLLGGYTDFEAKLTLQFGKAFGMALNTDRTVGDGTSKIAGLVGTANDVTTTGNGVAVDTTAVVKEVDFTDMIGSMNKHYSNHPRLRIHMSRAIEALIWSRRSSGIREFGLDNQRRLIMPFGIPFDVNPALAEKANATTDKVAMVFVPDVYHVLYAMGGMRFGREYQLISDEVLIAMRLSTDGQVGDEQGIFRLAGK